MNPNDKRIQHLNQYLRPDEIRTDAQEKVEVKYSKNGLFGYKDIQTQLYVDGIMHYRSGYYLRGHREMKQSTKKDRGHSRKQGIVEIPLESLHEYTLLNHNNTIE